MFAQTFPDVLQVACFDTAFYADVTEEEYLFEIPKSLSQEGVRRYVFHGLSYQYMMEALQSCRAGATRAAYSLCLVLIDRDTGRVAPRPSWLDRTKVKRATFRRTMQTKKRYLDKPKSKHTQINRARPTNGLDRGCFVSRSKLTR